MPWGASIEEKQRVLLPNQIPRLHFMKQFASVGKLRFKFALQLLAYLITAALNAGPDGGANIFGLRAVLVTHSAYTFLGNPLYRAAPARMEGGHDLLFLVHQEHRQAIRSQDCDQHSRRVGDQTIARKLAM